MNTNQPNRGAAEMETNLERSNRAADTLSDYIAAGYGDPDDAHASIIDLITDLLHLADDLTYNPEAIVEMAQKHYSAERG